MNQSTMNGAAIDLQTRLNDPQTIDALTRLLDRAETLATAVETAEGLLQQGPGLVSVFTDSVDEFYGQTLNAGTDLEIVLQHGLQVATKLQNPRLINVLTKMLDQTDALEMIVSLLEQGPGMVAIMADSLDEIVNQTTQSGVDPELLLQNGLQLATKLQNPRLIEALSQLLSQTESIEMLASLAEQGPGVVAIMADSLDEMVRQAAEAGVDLEQILPKVLHAASKLVSVIESEEFDALMDSGILDPQTVRVVGNAGKALTHSYQTPIETVTVFGLLKTMNDPDMQRALGFLVKFAKQFGRELS